MKPFDLKEFNVDGRKFVDIHLKFTLGKPLEVHIDKPKVSKDGRAIPAGGCDFVAGGCSRSSENFIEVGGMPEITVLGNNFSVVRTFAYIQLENERELVPKLKEHFLSEIFSHSNAVSKQALKAARQCKRYLEEPRGQ